MIEIIECNPLLPLMLAISVNDFWATFLRWRDLEQVERVRRGGGRLDAFCFITIKLSNMKILKM